LKLLLEKSRDRSISFSFSVFILKFQLELIPMISNAVEYV
jgi:hypothetical protein